MSTNSQGNDASADSPFAPLVHEFPEMVDLEQIFLALRATSRLIFFDGCGDHQMVDSLNRYSYFATDPIEIFEAAPGETLDLADLHALWRRLPKSVVHKDLPPFQGGWAGYLSYELGSRIESVPVAKVDEFLTPIVSLGLYDVVLAIDHLQKRAWLLSHGWPKIEPETRRQHADARLKQFLDRLDLDDKNNANAELKPVFKSQQISPRSAMHPIDRSDGLTLYSDFSREQFLQAVEKTVDYIHAGDIFQANISQRLLSPITKSSTEMYLDMRNVNPAPFSGFYDFGCGQLISASPERLICLNGSEIETRPIKGTRKRSGNERDDQRRRSELLDSEKDRAENTMIVDLMRNDLSKVSLPDSVRVQKLCGLEEYASVMHLVSVVQSELAENNTPIDLVCGVFPGGSITGAPKIRAMQIIAELEPTTRGPYCGSLGYIGFDGTVDFNILIRTIVAKDGWWQISVGGGIVSDSNPEFEYQETWTKAAAMLDAIARGQSAKSHSEQSAVAAEQQ